MKYQALLFSMILGLSAGCMAPRSQFARADTEAIEKERELQKEVAIQTQVTRTIRLNRVAYPIWTKNADLCGEQTKHSIWLMTTSSAQLDKDEEFGSTVKRLFGVVDQPTVTLVIPGTPADVAGFKPGDVLIEVNGKVVPTGALTEETWTDLRSANKKDLIAAVVQRAGQRIELTATPVKSCVYGITYVPQDILNAFADGKNVFITSGMMRFTENDDELALVLGHELAHNARGHIEAKKTNALGGLIFDILAAAAGVNTQGAFSNAAASSYSQEFESEADYVGLYYAARAGYDYKLGPHFWRRMAAENPGSIRGAYGASHPTTPERFAGLDKTASEITSKSSVGAKLTPNERDAENTQ